MPPLPRGICPVCGRLVPLRRTRVDGDRAFREHNTLDPQTKCPGSGKTELEIRRG